ncbi:MAG TPA: hypothetical protein VHR16_11125 [Candidatus Limnocylindrales bacterium]|jgi:hypothetical protein|nr:hypothetical protein [Candidatus Limnocylindrales bacterium]
MRYDIYAWAGPRDLGADDAAARIDAWEAEGGDVASAPFEPSSDVAGFYREVESDLRDMPGFEALAAAEPHRGRGPVWLQTEPAPPAPIAAIRLPRGSESALREALADIYGTATKFDLMVLDATNGVIHEPMAEMSAYAKATFWPRGAIRAAVFGIAGLLAAVAAYAIGIPIVSGLVIIVGLFLVAITVFTFFAELRSPKGPPQ